MGDKTGLLIRSLSCCLELLIIAFTAGLPIGNSAVLVEELPVMNRR